MEPSDLKAIFSEALARPEGAERSTYLDDACAGDPALRDRVLSLLQAHDQAGTFLVSAVDVDPDVDPGTATAETLADDQPPGRAVAEGPGSIIGPYRLLERIGAGGMGVVYLAEQEHPVRRRVAVKIIKPGMDTEQVIARFEAERQALAMMDHPHIAKVLDAGSTASGRPYFVMELVGGRPITEYCDAARLTPQERLKLFIPVCQAIQHAHQKGVIHRDVKPSNVLVATSDGRPFPKVIDFGVAKATDQRLTERTLFTRFGIVIGTLEYMSPEQAEPGALDVDTRSDVYSLGALLYELLTGTTPLEPLRLREAAYSEILRMIREEDAPKPSTRLSESRDALPSISVQRGIEPARLERLVRGELDWIVMKAIEKDRARRYQTANGLARDIQRYLDGDPVEAGPPSKLYRVTRLARKHKIALATTLGFVALLVMAAAISTSLMIKAVRSEQGARQAEAAARLDRGRALAAQAEAQKERDAAVAEKHRADQQAAMAKAVSDFFTGDLLAEASPQKNPRDKNVSVLELLGRAAAKIPDKFAGQPEAEAAIRIAIGETYRELGSLADSQIHLTRALELSRQALGPEHPHTLSAMNALAVLLWARGRPQDAEPLLKEMLPLASRVFGPDHPDTLSAMYTLALIHHTQAHYDQAEPLFRQILDGQRRVLGKDHRHTLVTMGMLAVLYHMRGQFDRSEPLFLEVLDGFRRQLGPNHFYTLTCQNNLAAMYRDQGRLDRAEGLFKQAYEGALTAVGPEHPNTLASMTNLGEVHRRQGRYDQAEPLIRQALEIRRRVLGPEHRDTLFSVAALARLEWSRGRRQEAESLLKQVLEARRKTLGADHPDILATLHELGDLYQDQGHWAEAETMLRQALEGRRRKLGPDHPGTAATLVLLGFGLLERGRFAEAEPLFREGLAIQEKRIPESWPTFETWSLLGASLSGQFKYSEAEPLVIAGYEGLAARKASLPAADQKRLREAADRILTLYETWGRADKLEEWRKRLKTSTTP